MASKTFKAKFKINKKNKIAIVIVAVLICIVLVTLIANNSFDIFGGNTNDYLCTSILSGKSNILLPSEFDLNSLLEVHFIDIGQGDAMAIMLPDGKIFFIDAGSGTNASKSTKESYNKYLSDNLHVDKVEYMVVTHSHTDHFNLFEGVLTQYQVDMVLFNNDATPSKSYESFCNKAKDENNVNIVEISNGEDSILIIESDKYKITIFSAGNDGFKGAKSEENSMSIICLLEYGTVKVLFTGDAEKETEQWFVQYALSNNIDIDVDVLKVGHHGSNSSSTTLFLDNIKPEYAVISCGENNSFDHPSIETMDSFYNYGIATYRTDKHGSVVLYIDSDGDFGFLPEKNASVENLKNEDSNARTIPLIKK